jgi:hypothetical protein
MWEGVLIFQDTAQRSDNAALAPGIWISTEFDAAANRPFQQVRLVESGQAVTRGTASRLSPSAVSRILRADLDATRHRFRLLRNRHGQHAILTGRIDSGTIHRVRQYKTPIK